MQGNEIHDQVNIMKLKNSPSARDMLPMHKMPYMGF